MILGEWYGLQTTPLLVLGAVFLQNIIMIKYSPVRTLLAFGEPLIGSYLSSATARVPVDDPSINSIGGGSKLLNASMSFAGRSWE